MHRKAGFTLIELLLVLVIIGVMAAISVPSFVRSMQGNRLRAAARTVAAAGRYARSMAVLHQRPVAVTFALDGHRIVVDLEHARLSLATGDPVVDGFATTMAEGAGPAGTPATKMPASETGGNDPVIRIERLLEGVRIVDVDSDVLDRRRRAAEAAGEVAEIVYGTNGRCKPHRIVIEDSEGLQFVVDVDLLGSVEIRDR